MKHRKLYTFVAILILTGFIVGLGVATQPAQAAIIAQINFQDPGTTPPAGYLRDFGEAYGLRAAANQAGTYGWVVPNTNTPLDLSVGGATPGNGRNRNNPADVRLATLFHMQYTGGNGTAANGSWEYEIPNGNYTVDVSVGDSTAVDSTHVINVEGVTAIAGYIPTGGADSFGAAQITVIVNDGRLTIDAIGGTNTKINYVIIQDAIGPVRPSVQGVNPNDGSTGVPINSSITAQPLYLPNFPLGTVDDATVLPTTVYLHPTGGDPVTDRVPVSSVNTTGGGDAITLVPAAVLLPNTNYTFVITDGVQDISGAPFIPFSSTFTTGGSSTGGNGSFSFTQVALAGVAANGEYTSVEIGPDGRLYSTTLSGLIYHWDINPVDGTLSNQTAITSLGSRIAIGLDFDPASTPTNPILWVSHNLPDFDNQPAFSGAVSRLVGTNVGTGGENWVATQYISHLPRSAGDHLTNSLRFGPDGALYLLQGGMSAMGEATTMSWGNRPEVVLSAVIMRIDTGALISGGPISVRTGITDGDGINGLNIVQNFGLGELTAAGLYDPQAPGAPLTIYASGIRNAFDLVWHTNGRLYVPANGSAGGASDNGGTGVIPNTPVDPALLPACQNRLNGVNWTGPQVTLNHNRPDTQPDLLFNVVQNGYYGHPAPVRCEWIMNGGNPTAGSDVAQFGNHYPVGTLPDPNWRGISFSFQFNKSPNGAIEYRNGVAFGGAMQGRLMVVRYSQNDDIIILTPGGVAGNIVSSQESVPGMTGFNNPLDLIEDVTTGNLYVVEYGNAGNGSTITLLRPNVILAVDPNIDATPNPAAFSDVIDGAPSPAQTITITNDGGADLTISSITLGGTDAANYNITTAPGTPLVVPVGGSITVDVTYNADANALQVAHLQIDSNDPDTPSYFVSLNGQGLNGTGGNNEPSLQAILNAFSYNINVGDDDAATTPINGDGALGNYPGNILGQEVSLQRLEIANPAQPITVDVLASFAVDGAPTPVIAGWYPIADANNQNEIFRVDTGSGQMYSPNTTGTLSFADPGGIFGLYTQYPPAPWNGRIAFSQDALNTWDPDPTHRHKMRAYELRDAVGNIIPNAFVFGWEEYTEGWDYNDVVFILRNVQSPIVVPGGEVGFENLDWATPFNPVNNIDFSGLNYLNRWLTAHTIRNGTANAGAGPLLTHDTPVLRIRNDSPSQTMTVTGLTLSAPARWALPNAPILPFDIAPGSFFDLDVQFTLATGVRNVHYDTLTVSSSAPNEPSAVINLAGGHMDTDEGNEELRVQDVLDAYGFTTDLGTLPSNASYQQASPDEILAFYWGASDLGQPMYVRQLAAFHGCCTGRSRFVVTGPGGGTLRHHRQFGQSLLPAIDGNLNAPAERIYTPTDPDFEIVIEGYSTSRCEGVLNCLNNGTRLFQIRDLNGNLVPNTYLVIQDYVGGGCTFNGDDNGACDYNDNMYLVSNIQPSTIITDMTVTITDSADPVPFGNNVTLSVGAQNLSTFPAGNVIVTINLPASFPIVNITPPAGVICTPVGQTITCDFGSVNGETTETVLIEVAPGLGGTYNTTATVTTTTTESNNGNNLASESTLIDDPAFQPGTVTIIKEATPESTQIFSFTGDFGNFTLVDEGLPPVPFEAHVNFQLGGVPVPAGYIEDSGLPRADRGNGFTYGWMDQTNGTPIDGSAEARDRDRVGIAQELDTLMHMQRVFPALYWEIAVPNGTYQVTVSSGDEDSPRGSGNYDSAHTINVEGTNAINGFVSTAATEYLQATVSVVVTDGFLTIDALGGVNTKINYVDIVQTGSATSNTQSFTVNPGTYNVAEIVPAGWNLNSVVCVGGTSSSITNGASIQLVSAGNVTCTFTNEQITGAVIDLQKTPDIQNLIAGDTANFNIAISNIGIGDLTVTSLVDDTCDAQPVYDNGDDGDNILNVGETWNYLCSVANVTVDFTNTATVTAQDASLNVVVDSDTANVIVTPPVSVDLVKTATSPTVPAGNTALFTITVENTGVLDANITSITDDTCDAAPAYVSGDVDFNGELGGGEVWTYTCSVANVTVNFTNTASVEVQQVGGTDTATDTDTADIVVITAPAINLNKTATPLAIESGDTATFTFALSNTGNTDLIITNLSDPICDATLTFTGGDTDTDNQLDITEIWTYTCTVPNVTAGFTNTATVTATEVGGSGTVVNDSDTAAVSIAEIAIDKTPDNQTLFSGDQADFVLTVTNTGEIELTTIVVTDDTCDAAPVFVSGDTDTDLELDLGEVWVYTCSVTNVLADFTNTATAEGTIDTLTVNATDSANVVVFVNAPSIIIDKSTTTPTVDYGNDVEFTIFVQNNGNVDLTNVVVTDPLTPTCDSAIGNLVIGASTTYTCTATAVTADFDNIATVTGDDPSLNPVTDNSTATVTVNFTSGISIAKTTPTTQVQSGTDVLFTLTVENTGNSPLSNVVVTDDTCTTAVTLDSGDINTDNILDMTETWVYTCSVENAVVDFTNIATVEGEAVDTTIVNATDSVTVDVLQAPAIDIFKTPATQLVASGGTASYTIYLQNTGDVPLNTVTVTDVLCDAAPTLDSGDDNTDNILDLTEIWVYTCETTNVVAPFTNTATVTATAPDGVTDVTALDNAVIAVDTVTAPAIAIDKTPAVQTVNSGDTAIFNITVSNIGAVDLATVGIADDACDAAPAFVSGDTDTDNEIDLGEIWLYTCQTTNVTLPFTGTTTVNADGNGTLVTASDSAIVAVNGVDAPLVGIDKTPDNQTVNTGDTASFTITVNNLGTVDLLNVNVVDNTCTTPVVYVGGDTDIDNQLDLGETWTYTCDVVNVTQPFTNTASVTAEDATAAVVTASDSAVVLVNGVVGDIPSISITATPTSQDVVEGQTATFTVTVVNDGNVDLDNVEITNTIPGSDCSATIGTILVGEVVTFNCTVPNVIASLTGTINAEGEDTVNGVVVRDTTTVSVAVIGAPPPPNQQFNAFDPFVTKNAFPPFAIPGEEVTFVFYVSNPGSVPAINVVAIDPIPADVEIISVTQTSGTTSVNGQDVIFSINQLLPNETITITIETRVRDNVAVPFVITNEVCMNADNMPEQNCDTATVISVTSLPSTGETPLWSIILQTLMTLLGATIVVIGLGWTGRRVYLRTR